MNKPKQSEQRAPDTPSPKGTANTQRPRRTLQSATLRLHGQERVFGTVNRTLATDDGMYAGNDAYYLEVGANALHLILHALAVSDRDLDKVQRILDYACGFGRVLRWLQAGFPRARITAVDADQKATSAVKEIFEVDTHTLNLSLQEDFGVEFDLIWVGIPRYPSAGRSSAEGYCPIGLAAVAARAYCRHDAWTVCRPSHRQRSEDLRIGLARRHSSRQRIRKEWIRI